MLVTEKIMLGNRSMASLVSLLSRLHLLVRNPVTQSLAIYTGIILVLIWPTLDLYMWWGHAMLFPVVDVYEISKIWSVQGFGHVPWSPDYCFGYGYPYHTFYAPLGFYVGAVLHFLLGLDFGSATKLSFYASIYLSGLLMYAFAYTIGSRENWPRAAWWALAAATAYALARYHLTDVFSRSVLAESWAWTALPGVYWGMEVARRRIWSGILLTSLTYSGLLLSHNITALWATIFIAAYPLLAAENIKWPITVAVGGLLGTAMSAFFWYPALRLKDLTQSASTATGMGGTPELLHQHAVFWRQHFTETLGYGPSVPGPDDTLGINMGVAVLAGVLLGTIAVFQKGLTGRQRYRLGVFLLTTLVVLFIMSPQMPWQKVPAMFLYIQFPWRLLIFTSFFGAAAMAMASPVIDRWVHPAVLTALAAILAIPTLSMISMPNVRKRMSPEQLSRWNYRFERKGFYAGADGGDFIPKWVRGDYLKPEFLEKHPVPENRMTVTSGDLMCESFRHRGIIYEYRYKASTDSEARVAVFYWPGWELRIDGNLHPEAVKLGTDGLLSVSFPAGAHNAQLKYALSAPGRFGRNISVLGLVAWLSVAIFFVLRERRRVPQKAVPASC
jgi:hypothetical protein